LRHVEALSHKGKRLGKSLIDCQVGREDILYFQVGKGEEMSSVESSLVNEEEAEERPHSNGDTHRFVICVNEDDEKL
jgi:hypothetical protein